MTYIFSGIMNLLQLVRESESESENTDRLKMDFMGFHDQKKYNNIRLLLLKKCIIIFQSFYKHDYVDETPDYIKNKMLFKENIYNPGIFINFNNTTVKIPSLKTLQEP